MSERERKLLILLLTAFFVVGNLFGYKWLGERRAALQTEIGNFRQTIEVAEFARMQQESVSDQVLWLEQNLPEPREGELVPSQLETFVTQAATRAGLAVNRPKIEPSVDGVTFDRARFQISVTGSEAALYRWLVQLQNPGDFRAVTALRLSPNREDDTKIDATAQVEEWYLPRTP